MKYLSLACILLSFFLAPRPSSGAEDSVKPPGADTELSLTAAVDIAMRRNPLIQAAASGRKIADGRLEEARAGRWPLLQFTETFTRGNNPVFVFGSLLEQGRFGPQNFEIGSLNNPSPLNNFRTAVHLKVPLFDQLETGTRIAQAQMSQEEASRQLELVSQQVRFEVIRAYYGILIAQNRKEVAAEAIRMAEADRNRARDLFETGLVVRADLLSSEVQLSELRQQQVESAGELLTARAYLNTVLGNPAEPSPLIGGRLEERNFGVPDEEELVRQALRRRPDYLRAAATLRSTQEKIRGAWGQYLPRVDLFSTYGISGRDLASGDSDYIFGAGLTYNLFDRIRPSRLDQARAAYLQAKADLEQLANRLRLEVVQALQHYLSARENLHLAAQSVEQAREALRIVQDRYREGLTVITEVLRAQTALVRTQLSHLAARYNYTVGYANVLAASGQLADVGPFAAE